MKIAWFSPLPPARTEIAQVTSRIVFSGCCRNLLELWTDQSEWDQPLGAQVAVRRYTAETVDWEALNEYTCFYNIGNNAQFHEGIWRVSTQHAGIVILHDSNLQQFFFNMFRNSYRDKDAYRSLMVGCYGESVQTVVEAVWNEVISNNDISKKYLLTGGALQNVLGVVVHTQESCDAVRRCCPTIPLLHLELPYKLVDAQPPRRDWSNAPPLKLIVFGYLGWNRRVESILAALGTFSDRHFFELHIYGELWNKASIKKEIDKYNLRSNVIIHGYVSETELEQGLRSAHLALNLRYPTMGEASASQLRIWSHALPSVVTDVGWYATIPRDTAIKIGPENEVEELQTIFRKLIAQPDCFLSMGIAGYRLLQERHSPISYMNALIEFSRTIRDDPHYFLRECYIGHAMRGFQGFGRGHLNTAMLENLASQIQYLSTLRKTFR